MLHNQEDRCHTFDLEAVQWLSQGRNGIVVWELFVILGVGESQFWGGGVCYGAGNGEHLVVAIHQVVLVTGKWRLEWLLVAR